MIANALFSRQSKAKGFTLLELLIVITILAILAVIIIFVLNPAETLRKSRDVQRMSDLATLKNAISLYTTTKTSPILDGGTNTLCVGGSGADSLWVSYPSDSPGASLSVPPSGFAWVQVLNANLYKVDGTGWLKVDLGSISGGSPISNLPVDPSNTVTTASAVTNSDLMYRYTCGLTNLLYELNARMESTAFLTDDNKAVKDGGNNTKLYEVGTSLTLLAGTDDF